MCERKPFQLNEKYATIIIILVNLMHDNEKDPNLLDLRFCTGLSSGDVGKLGAVAVAGLVSVINIYRILCIYLDLIHCCLSCT